MDRRNRKKAPGPGMVWSEKHGMWTDSDARSSKKRGRDARVAASVEADRERVQEALRKAEAARQEQQSAIEGAAANVAQALLSSLIDARKESGLSQAEVARRMGVPQPVIVRLESGTHSPTLSTLSRYAAAVGVTLSVREPV